MRSYGRVAAFSGSLAESGAVKRALQARACNGEVIVMGVGSSEREMEVALNALLQLHALGIQNYLLAAVLEATCRQYATALGSAGCLWSDVALLAGTKDARMQKAITRWLVTSMALQLGYNTLTVADDSFMVVNWYDYVLSDVFGRPQAITPAGQNGFLTANGMAYLRGSSTTRPGNATLHLAFSITAGLVAASRRKTLPQVSASAVTSDALCSALAGRPISLHTSSNTPTSPDELRVQLQAACLSKLNRVPTELPKEWAERASSGFAAASQFEMVTGTLQVFDSTPLEGGQDSWLRTTAFAGSNAPGLRAFLAKDSGAERPNGTSAAPSMQENALLIAPPWLMSSWADGGQKGWWEWTSQYGPPGTANPPRVVLAHAEGLPDISSAVAVFKIVGWWHPRASELSVGHGLFLASTDADPMPKLLMLMPNSMLWPMEEASLWQLYAELARTAALAGRVPVWPGFDCTVTWTQRHPVIAESDPWMQRATKHYPAGDSRHGIAAPDIFAYSNVTERFLDLRCLPLQMLTHGCLSHGLSWGDWLSTAGMLSVKDRTPSAANTLRWEWVNTLLRTDQVMWVHGPSNVEASELLTALDEMADHKVVFLPKLFRPRGTLPPSSQGALAKLADLSRDCPVLEGPLAQLST